MIGDRAGWRPAAGTAGGPSRDEELSIGAGAIAPIEHRPMTLHQPVTLDPGTLEPLQAWAALQPWAAGVEPSALTTSGSYRFDDPDGEVGIRLACWAASTTEACRCLRPAAVHLATVPSTWSSR